MPGFKSFVTKLFIFLLPIIAGLTIYTYYYYYNDKYQDTINGREIYWAIKKGAKTKKVKKLLIGDSVAQQLFDNKKYNGSTYSLTSNQSVSCVGYYILLKEFLDNNRDSLPEQVILIANPLSLQNNLNQVYTFHYFLKPFYCSPWKEYFSPTVNRQIEKVPFYYLSQFPFFKINNWSPDFRPEKLPDGQFLAPITIEYVQRMKNLCDSLHIPFAIISPPVSVVYRKEITDNIPVILNESAGINMQTEFAAYVSSLRYMDNSLYKDEMHFLQPEKVDIEYIKALKP